MRLLLYVVNLHNKFSSFFFGTVGIFCSGYSEAFDTGLLYNYEASACSTKQAES
jgi:hypothetical protein